jgi:hypothetical protein
MFTTYLAYTAVQVIQLSHTKNVVKCGKYLTAGTPTHVLFEPNGLRLNILDDNIFIKREKYSSELIMEYI